MARRNAPSTQYDQLEFGNYSSQALGAAESAIHLMSNPSANSPVVSPRPPSVASLMEILFCALAGTASEVFLKMGAAATASRPNIISWLGTSGLESKWVWLGIIFTVLGFVAWMRVLKAVPLSIAITLSNVIHVFVPVSCWIFLHEAISPRRWIGIALVSAGLAIVARPFARLDEKIEEAL